MIGFYDYTVIATYLASLLGIYGVFQAIEGSCMAALGCLLVSGLLDTVDGKIARTKKNRTPAQCSFGIQIDSLNDVLCFGLLPAAIAYTMARQLAASVPAWYTAALCFFTLCGLIRLAYFNVLEQQRQDVHGGAEARAYYLGLPITASTLLFPLLYIAAQRWPAAALYLVPAGMTLIGMLYITPLRLRHPDTKGIVVLALLGALELWALLRLPC